MARSTFGLATAAALALTPPAQGAEGKATLPLTVWERMLTELQQAQKSPVPPINVLAVERSIEGSLRKGLFSGRMLASFEVLETRGHVRVPVLDAAASLGEVRLNGRETSLLNEGGMYTVGVDRPGSYLLDARFYWGKEQDRFSRRLRFRVPEAGVTRLSVLVPEHDIDAQLARGVLVSTKNRSDGTLLDGRIDAAGLVDLAWNRRLTHRSREQVRMEARLDALFTVQEAMVQGLAVLDLDVLEGEADRVDLRLPAGVEVVRVEGDAVLQWHTDARGGGLLTVLFRHLVEEETRVSVYFQFPSEAGKPVTLSMPLPPEGVTMTGALGVQAPAGLDVQVAKAAAAEQLTLRDLPPELTELTTSPLLFGFSFTTPPLVELTVGRHEAVELTSTLIDDLQASTVVIEDGSEVTKLKLRIRNNTRQYLGVRLPQGSLLTHSLIDGQPVRPAVSDREAGEVLLFPLRQSERIDAAGERWHNVGVGETLTHIANNYYSDPSAWRVLLEANADQLMGEHDLAVGQQLLIPVHGGAVVEESSFVIELAYKRRHAELGKLGRLGVMLPELDVDTVQTTWHLYLPSALSPLTFDANLTQYSSIRYDPFRRARDFLRRALFVRWAWAGGGSRYQNILSQRKGIFLAESERKGQGKMVLTAFPLVGERYRFRRILLGRDTPQIQVTYVTRSLAPVVRWTALLAAFALALLLLLGGRDRRVLIAAGVSLAVLLVAAYFVLGVHRRIVWGVDLALLVMLARLKGPAMWRWMVEHAQSPWRLVRLISVGNLAVLIAVLLLLSFVLFLPLLLSTVTLVLASLYWWRAGRLQAERGAAGGCASEVAHA